VNDMTLDRPAAQIDVPKETMLGAEVIVDHLLKKKVPYLFGVSGHGIMGLLDTVYDVRDTLKTVSVHHESVGPFMADVYYRVSRQPVCAFASCGPGASNLYVSVATAQADSSAMLVLTGNVATQHWNRGTFQESSQFFQGDFINSMRPYVKRAFQPTRADMLPATMRQVFQELESGQPAPVHLDVPFNVFRESVDRDLYEREGWANDSERRARAAGDPAAIGEAIDLLLKAERPLIVAGHGVKMAGAEEALRLFAEALGIPLAVTPLAKDLIDNRHPLCIGQLGRNGSYHGNQASRNADVLIAIGTRFDDRSTSAWIPGATYDFSKTKLIHVDNNPAQIGKNYPVHLGITGDASVVIAQLTDAARARGGANPALGAWRARIAEWADVWAKFRATHRDSDAVPIRPERMINDLRAVLPDEGILVADVGLHHNWVSAEFDARRPNSFFHNWGYGAMGFGVAGPLGAKLAAPDRPVVSVCGDGGFMMLPSAILTAVEYDIPVVWVVWNNYGYVSIRDVHAGTMGGGREIATSFRKEATGELFSADIAGMARAMGAAGHLVEKPGDFAGVLEQAIRSNRPTVIEVRMERDAHVPITGSWELPPLPPLKPSLQWEA